MEPNEQNNSTVFTDEELRKYGMAARRRESKIHEKCFEICHHLGNVLIDEGMPFRKTEPYTVQEVWLGPNQKENHFIFILDREYYERDGDAYIDLSLDQFCDQNKRDSKVNVSFGSKEDIPSVLIYTQRDCRLEKYHGVDDILSK
jgi:hypothetical protein